MSAAPTNCPVACPMCGVPAGEKCRTLTNNRITEMHTLRLDAWGAYRDRQRWEIPRRVGS